jgi:hypothetical protein
MWTPTILAVELIIKWLYWWCPDIVYYHRNQNYTGSPLSEYHDFIHLSYPTLSIPPVILCNVANSAVRDRVRVDTRDDIRALQASTISCKVRIIERELSNDRYVLVAGYFTTTGWKLTGRSWEWVSWRLTYHLQIPQHKSIGAPWKALVT